jgi:hypothetical protein
VSTIFHIVRTDLRRWWPLMLTFVVGTLALSAVDELAPVTAFQRPEVASTINLLVVIGTTAWVALWCLLVALVVQETPLVEARAFWRTRPIAGWQVVTAKVLTLMAVLTSTPVVIDAIQSIRHGLAPELVAADALASLVGWRLVLLLLLVVVASLSRSLVSYLVSLVLSVLVVIAAFFAFLLVLSRGDLLDAGSTRPRDIAAPVWQAADAVRFWLQFLIAFVAPLVILIWSRRRLWSIAAMVALLLLCLFSWWPPFPGVRPLQPEPPSWASAPTALRASIDVPELSTSHPRPDLPETLGRERDVTFVEAGILVSALPPGYFAEVRAINGRFRLADGGTLEARGRPEGRGLPSSPSERPGGRRDVWMKSLGRNVAEAALPGAARSTPKTTIGVITGRGELARLLRGPVGYASEIVIDLWQYRLVSHFARGAVGRVSLDGQVLDVVAVRHEPSGPQALVRIRSAHPWLRSRVSSDVHVAFEHRDREEALAGIPSAPHGDWRNAVSLFGFTRAAQAVDGWNLYTALSYSSTRTVDAQWLADAGLAVVEMRYTGRVTRRLAVDGLIVHPPTAPPPTSPTPQ